jgi:hypothetical protein
MRNRLLFKISLIAVLLTTAFAARSLAAGCTACVQTDDGTWGCYVNYGDASWCVAWGDGSQCVAGYGGPCQGGTAD